MGSGILSVLRLGSSKCLKDVSLLGACEEHDNPAIISPDPEGRVILGLNGRLSFIHIPKTEDVVHGCVESEPGKDVGLLGRSYLHKLAADLNDDVYLTFGLRKSGNRLEDISCVSDDAYRFAGKIQLAEMEVGLELLKTSNQQVVNVPGVKSTGAGLGRDTEQSTETFAMDSLVSRSAPVTIGTGGIGGRRYRKVLFML